MELSSRKQDVLKLVVESYIQNGEPIGSKSMCEALGGISSATIRNEMSTLEDLQLLCHPHTSAGRIPTLNGFKFYIENLMNDVCLTKEQKRFLDSLLPDSTSDKKLTIKFAASALSQATRCTVIVTDRADATAMVHKVEAIPINSSTVLIMLITSSGNVLSRTYRFQSIITDKAIDAFLRLTSQQLVGQRFCDIQPACLQTAVAQSGEFALETAPLVSALSELIDQAGESKLELVGESNLLSCADYSVVKAKEIFSLLTRRDEVLNLLEIWDKDSGVILGGDTPYRALENASLVVSKYDVGPSNGYIGIIGPTRMDYKSIVPSLKYFANSLSNMSDFAKI